MATGRAAGDDNGCIHGKRSRDRVSEKKGTCPYREIRLQYPVSGLTSSFEAEIGGAVGLTAGGIVRDVSAVMVAVGVRIGVGVTVAEMTTVVVTPGVTVMTTVMVIVSGVGVGDGVGVKVGIGR
jgi:hypothetical protein